MQLPIVAIVGRPNVGKSTLLNRLAGGSEAIVYDQPGVTRDRLYLPAEWCGYRFEVVDTGGLVFEDSEVFLPLIREQVEIALAEAAAVLFVVDGQQGITGGDREVADWLRGRKPPVLIVANKLEEPSTALSLAAEFYALGLGEPYAVSAIHGSGTGDLLDALVAVLPKEQPEAQELPELRVSIVGRPNVGKSSLLNALVGGEHPRSMVSEVAGTTRDAIDTLVERGERRYRLIDTAGIRRKSRVDYGPEAFGVTRAIRAIRRADVVVLVVDATEGIHDQERNLAAKIASAGRACVLVVNKWDAIEKDTYTMNHYRDEVRRELDFVEWAPVVFTSALTGQRVEKIFDAIDAAAGQHQRRVSTSVLNEALQDALLWRSPPASRQGRQGKVYYATQIATNPPTFVLFVNDTKLFKEGYRRYLEGQFRGSLGFEGSPVRFIFRGKPEREANRTARKSEPV
ncbi:ribosome biogenesis GTPase Der [Gloeobacter morelensis]|uniref:GTPase Der n=1 Tax=Gloeobacter morelensis MG652769 TaxID=2781736 RepID=A0ABY3PRM9_9CYAN|nr:ribosome biogenesis GTPase Der [Gloeobacter morelensis]UFP96362.1 ribosome biogenesis GTPase Der [Gloeobacter morelensis MG652769]